MKKLLMAGAVAAIMLGGASCNKSAATGENSALSDSLSTMAGQSMGADVNQQLQMWLSQQPDSIKNNFSKDEFMRGFEAALKVDTTNQSYVMGYQVGLNGWNFAMAQNRSVKVNIDKMVSAFKEAFMMDSINAGVISQYQQDFQALMNRIQQEQIKKAQEAKAKSPEAVANKNAGEAFVNKQKAADPAIKTSATGLSYKIDNEGTGAKVQKSDKVKIKYVGKLIDGKEFDKNEEGVELNAGNFVPGFTEGLMLLGKGGKATLYIPADLAYGVDGIPQAGIGPNSTLVFDVEVLDITPAAQGNQQLPGQPVNM